MRLGEDERDEVAGRFLEGSLTRALHAVWRDLAAFGSLIASDMVSRSVEAMSDILGVVRTYNGKETGTTFVDSRFSTRWRVPWLLSL